MTAAGSVVAAGFQQRVAGQPGVPDRRDAGLAIGLVFVDDRAASRPSGARWRGADDPPDSRAPSNIITLLAIAGKIAPRPSSPLRRSLDPGDGAVDRALARPLRKIRLGRAQHVVDAAEEPEPRGFLLRRLRRRADASPAASTNSSSIRTPFALRARGFFAIITSSGTMTVRLQYEILSRWNGNQFGSSMISTGITGTARHGTKPNSASMMRVKTFARAAPPRASIASRARRMCGASMESPIILSAKYAFTVALMSRSPSRNSGQPPWSPWMRRR